MRRIADDRMRYMFQVPPNLMLATSKRLDRQLRIPAGRIPASRERKLPSLQCLEIRDGGLRQLISSGTLVGDPIMLFTQRLVATTFVASVSADNGSIGLGHRAICKLVCQLPRAIWIESEQQNPRRRPVDAMKLGTRARRSGLEAAALRSLVRERRSDCDEPTALPVC